ncbi:hypothetical protein FJZ48_04010 [Candidatus Uhrbacteria bacterium]|nr:hypothetical protein [Candidatus Uhrbacteria bacterium]
MKTTYLAIFTTGKDTLEKFKKMLSSEMTPEEKMEMEAIADRFWKDPKSITEPDLQKMNRMSGKQQLMDGLEGKLKSLVDQHFKMDGEEVSWGMLDVMTSEEFFYNLNPDESIPLSKRIDFELLPQEILLPDGTWIEDQSKNVLNEYRAGHPYAFFVVDE